MDRYNMQTNVEQHKGRPVSALDAARANDFFDSFLNANTLKTILGTYRSICDLLHLKPNALPLFYPRLKEHLTSWRAKALWKKFDARANNKCYGKGKLCPNTRVLIIGAGPCGLRTAIEAQLLGAKVVVVEKRDRISRNNVLHLWPFVIDDLRLLGAKKFFGKFCAGAIDHISIRQLQCILLKVALLLGVEIHTEVSFEQVIEPNAEEKTGWKAEFKPIDHPVNQFEFDVVVGADGKRNTLQGFKRKEFRGKLAIAITANFINKRTEAEARVEEISGVAFIFNQKFFKDLFAETGIDLENIVYYKDDTHYFVMTAKKQSLIDKGVIKQDLQDTARLLAHENVDRDALMNYAREAAEFSTNYMMLELEFAVNHYGQPDVAMFDFTSMYQAENASRIIERHGYKLLSILVGDSLLEPFWPTGSGCARGFLSSLDAGWAIRAYGSRMVTPLEVLAERESIYRLLPQTTPENLNRDYKSYTLDPSTRYPNLNRNLLLPQQVLSLYDSDDVNSIELQDNPHKRRRRNSNVDPDTLLCWVRDQVKEHDDLEVANITTSFQDGRVLCAIICHYRPDLLDYSGVTVDDARGNNQAAFDVLERELGVQPLMTVDEMLDADVPDFRTMVAYLTQIYDTFRGEVPHVKYAKLRALSSTRKCLMSSSTIPSRVSNGTNEEKSKISLIERHDKVLIELYKSNCMTVLVDPVSLASIRDERVGLKKDAVNFSDSRALHSDSSAESGNVVQTKIKLDSCTSTTRDALKMKFIAESQRLQDRIDKVINSRCTNKAKITKTRPSVRAIKCNDNTTCCVQTEPPLVVKVNECCGCCLEDERKSVVRRKCDNLGIIVKDKHEVHSFSFDARANCLYIVLPDLLQKIRSNLISGRQLDVFKDVNVCKRHDFFTLSKFLSLKMSKAAAHSEYNFDRVVNWISASNFNQTVVAGSETPKTASVQNLDGLTDITSVTRQKPLPILAFGRPVAPMPVGKVDASVAEKTPPESEVADGISKILEELKAKTIELKEKSRQQEDALKIGDKYINKQDLNDLLSVLLEADERDLPDTRRHQDAAFTKNHPAIKPAISANASAQLTAVHHRPATRHRRHAELPEPTGAPTGVHDRKSRKKRSTMEKLSIGGVEERAMRLEEIASNRSERQSKRRQQRRKQTEQFIKSMQMLQANSISENSEPFEDYSIFLYRQTAPNFEDRVKDLEKKFTYIPDHENRPPVQQRGENDEDFKARVMSFENKPHDSGVTVKKPKDFLRAIGKLDNTDWNIKEIEKKIIENKLGKNVNKDKEKVPKWSKEQFQARQLKMEKQHLERQESCGDKFAEIDKNIKQLDQRLKEGTVRDQNRRKVAQITEKLKPKTDEAKPVQKNTNKPAVILPNQGKSDSCHFCNKRVYLMERLSAEDRHFHRGCFRCQYCQTALRLGSYMFDRDGKYGYRFYCTQHFGMPGEIKQSKIVRKPLSKEKTPERKFLTGVAGVDLLDRGETPERIEFDLSAGQASSDHEEPLSQMDEDEWTDRNFGASTAELGSSDDDDSSFSESDEEDDDAFEEALEEPPTKEGTLKLFNTLCKKRFSQKHRNASDSDSYSSSDRSSYYENSSGDDDSDTATEGEEEIRARERRKMEVQVKPPIVHTDTGTDTEIASDDDTSSSSEIQNSATEISTDSEFAHDDPTPTCEIPAIVFNDMFVTKTRGSGKLSAPQRVHVKTGELAKPMLNATASKPSAFTGSRDIELKFTPLVQSPAIQRPVAPLLLRNAGGFALNRTQSTGGIATKVSLELKKKYLLGESNPTTAIQKSGSASTLDSKFKSFHSNISDCQKLLKPSAEISASMQTFCNRLDEQRTSPISPLATSRPSFKLPDFKPIESSCSITQPAPPVLNTTKEDVIEEQPEVPPTPVPVVPNESEGRPRSPVHETSIIVPQIDWSQQSKDKQLSSEGSTDSTTSTTDSEENHIQKSPSVKAFNVPPEVRDNNNDNIPMDSLNYIAYSKIESQPSSFTNDPPKSIASEKKALNQPKTLPKLDDDMFAQVHSALHMPKPVIVEPVVKPEENTEKITTSGRSTPSHESGVYQVTAALTETELSDWAHDGMVSDDFAESDYEVKIEEVKDTKPVVAKKATLVEAENPLVTRTTPIIPNEPLEPPFECINNILCPTLENIEFMDTGSESSEEEELPIKNNGYVQFHDEDDIAEDSLSPVINKVIETTNPVIKATLDEDFDALSTVEKNTGYCFIDDGQTPTQNTYGGAVIDLKPTDLQVLKEKQSLVDNEEDSLIIVEKSTTDDNTCSDSTVKNVMEMAPRALTPPPVPETPPPIVENNNTLDKKRLEDKLAKIKTEMKTLSDQRKAAHIEEQNMRNNIEFEQHCQRLQSKVDFGNAKDSIDIRKARRQSKSGSPPKPDLIQEEKEVVSPIRSRREQIELERDMNKKLVQEMVLNKMRAENKSLERKRRNRKFSPNLSPSRPYEMTKSPTTDISSHVRLPTPDVLLSTINTNTQLQKSETLSDFPVTTRTKFSPLSSKNSRPLSTFEIGNTELAPMRIDSYQNPELHSLPDIHKALVNDYNTPKAPPRTKNEGNRVVEKLKEDARARARLLSDEDLGLSPEDKLAQLRVRLARRGKENDDVHIQNNAQPLTINTERPTSLFYKNDTLNKKKIASFRRSKSGEEHLNLKVSNQPTRERTKSFGETQVKLSLRSAEGNENKNFKSDPNLLLASDELNKKKEKKSKDRERRKSITKFISDFFAKKKDFNVTAGSNSNKGFLSRISPKARDKSKDIVKEGPVRRMSYTECRKFTPGNVSPPPIPPLPLNYTGAKSIDDSSEGEGDFKRDRSSCDTLDQSGIQEGSLSSRRSSSRSARKARQSQTKRHRMAQEVQRKLEETDVKIRELELRGVTIEKTLRGECESSSSQDDATLLKEWFDLMKDITELRRYERALMVRGQELELEDRHARLQHDLKERLSNELKKTPNDIEMESCIIQEMLDIVAKRDSLIVLLDEERQRYKEEDKTFEEQMVEKGIYLPGVQRSVDATKWN